MSDLFRDFFRAFLSLIDSEISEQASKGLQKCQVHKLGYCNVSRDKSSKIKQIDSPSFNGFHAQLDCMFTYGNKNQT